MVKKASLWVIEESLMGCGDKWIPEVDTYKSKKLAIKEMYILRRTNPGVKFRVRKYERIDA